MLPVQALVMPAELARVDALLLEGIAIPGELIEEQKAIQARLTRILRAGEK